MGSRARLAARAAACRAPLRLARLGVGASAGPLLRPWRQPCRSSRAGREWCRRVLRARTANVRRKVNAILSVSTWKPALSAWQCSVFAQRHSNCGLQAPRLAIDRNVNAKTKRRPKCASAHGVHASSPAARQRSPRRLAVPPRFCREATGHGNSLAALFHEELEMCLFYLNLLDTHA